MKNLNVSFLKKIGVKFFIRYIITIITSFLSLTNLSCFKYTQQKIFIINKIEINILKIIKYIKGLDFKYGGITFVLKILA